MPGRRVEAKTVPGKLRVPTEKPVSEPAPKKHRRTPPVAGGASPESLQNLGTVDDPDNSSPRSLDAKKFRPHVRPPMAVLWIFDDDMSDAEKVRLREDETVIGRKDCDVVIAHDRLMSANHAKIVRKFEEGTYRWYIVDLNSSNRTWLKIRGGPLKHGAELLIGGFRYRFELGTEAAPPLENVTQPRPSTFQPTVGFRIHPQKESTTPCLVRVTGETERRLPIRSNSEIIGSNGQASICIDDDPYLTPRTARIYLRATNKRWQIEDLGSDSGIWMAVDHYEINQNAMFQLGEQRFELRFPL